MTFDACELLDMARKMLVLAAHTEGTAERLGHHELGHVVFKRVAEFQHELIETIENLLGKGLIRPAFASLRTSLELTTSFSWLADDFDNRLDRFSKGRCPGVQKMMSSANLGWQDEYTKTYTPLSDFVHGSFILSDFNKVEKVYNHKEDVPYSALGDYFLLQAGGSHEIRLVEDRPREELVALHSGFIAAKAVDSVLTMLIRATGDYSDAFPWWPGQKHIESFDRLVTMNWTDMHFLWLSEKQRLAICRVDGRYA